MEILYILVPLAVVLAAVAIAAFILSVRSGQYDDLDGAAHRILMDDDDPMIPKYKGRAAKKKETDGE